MTPRNDSITRWECDTHGPLHITYAERCPVCGEAPELRTYVAVDALLSDEAIAAVAKALRDRQPQLNLTYPWDEEAREAVETAIAAALPGEQTDG